MKKIVLFALFLLSLEGYAQKVYDLDKKDPIASAKITGDVAIYKGVNHPVYITKTGKLFILVVSKKTGKEYRKYLK